MNQESLKIWDGSNNLQVWEGKTFKGTGRLKIRQEGRSGQTRGYSIEELSRLEFSDSDFREYCPMVEWNPENIMDLAFLSKEKQPKKFQSYVSTWNERGILYSPEEFEPFLVMKETQQKYHSNYFFWKGAFLHKKSKMIWFFQGFKPVQDYLDELNTDKNVYYSNDTSREDFRILKNCSMQASKQFWIELRQRAEESI